jgi:hypothetical protein
VQKVRFWKLRKIIYYDSVKWGMKRFKCTLVKVGLVTRRVLDSKGGLWSVTNVLESYLVPSHNNGCCRGVLRAGACRSGSG